MLLIDTLLLELVEILGLGLLFKLACTVIKQLQYHWNDV